MATIKSFTDLSQSKVLAEFLPIESSDMFCADVFDKEKESHSYNFHILSTWGCNTFEELKDRENKLVHFIPCWSLAALLQVLPLGIYDEFDNCDYELEIDMIDKMPRYIRLGDIYHSKFPYDFEKDTLLDNVVESIIWLNDNNYFEL